MIHSGFRSIGTALLRASILSSLRSPGATTTSTAYGPSRSHSEPAGRQELLEVTSTAGFGDHGCHANPVRSPVGDARFPRGRIREAGVGLRRAALGVRPLRLEPLQTPAFERIDVLLGKYGDEADKLVFKILRRGEHEASGEADLALRYDMTVPLARVAAAYGSKLPTPYKRYAIGPVSAGRPAGQGQVPRVCAVRRRHLGHRIADGRRRGTVRAPRRDG